MTAHLIRIYMDGRATARWMARRNLDDRGYGVHALCCSAFGDLRPHPFMEREAGNRIQVSGYSAHSADELKAAMAETGDPEAIICFEDVVSKAMPTSWVGGRTFGFELMAAPTVRMMKDDRRIERDVFLNAVERGEAAEGREAVYLEWLRTHIPTVFKMETASLDGFTVRDSLVRVHVGEGSKRKPHRSRTPCAVFKGSVTVGSAEMSPQEVGAAVSEALLKGVGRYKVCGMGALFLTGQVPV